MPMLAGKTFNTGLVGNRKLVNETMVLSRGMADVDLDFYAELLFGLIKGKRLFSSFF
jgi:hypothetical protein